LYVIGLTGGIATGKSTVSRFLKEEGAIVIDADQIAREVVRPGLLAWRDIASVFGEEVILPNGEIDRQRLGRIVFADPAARKRLNEITHPRIAAKIAELVAGFEAEGAQVVVLEAPLLIEAGLADSVNEIWVTDLNRKEQVRRLLGRDAISPEEAERRVDSQLLPEARRACANRIISTDGSEAELKDNIRHLWADLKYRLEKDIGLMDRTS